MNDDLINFLTEMSAEELPEYDTWLLDDEDRNRNERSPAPIVSDFI